MEDIKVLFRIGDNSILSGRILGHIFNKPMELKLPLSAFGTRIFDRGSL